MEPRDLKVGEIVQLKPELERGEMWFGGCLLVVSELATWGARGYVKDGGVNGKSYSAYIDVDWADMVPTGGTTVWILDPEPPPSSVEAETLAKGALL